MPIVIAPIVTMDPARPRASALATSGDRIVAVGTVDDVRAACPDEPVVELPDSVVVPGLIDAHHHMIRGGLKALSVPFDGSWDAASYSEAMDRHAGDEVWPTGTPTLDDHLQGLRTVQPLLHAMGITSVVDPSVTVAEMRAYQRARALDLLTMRVVAMPHPDLGPDVVTDPGDALTRLDGIGVSTGFGDDRLRIGGIKIYFDGEGMKRQALLEQEWTPGSGDFGLQRVSDDVFRSLASFCARNGWSLGVHAVGGGGVARVLRILAEVDEQTPIRDLRFQLIHGYLEPSADSMALLARLGVVASLQPSIAWNNAAGLIERLGDRAVNADPLRDWLDAGATVALGSDGPFFAFDPRHLMWKARTRAARGFDHPVGPAQAITGTEALAGYTTGAAYAAFAEHDRGMLRPGFYADWTALSADPTTCTPDEILSASVRRTVVGGVTVHTA